MKQNISAPVAIGILVVVVLVIGFFVWRADAPQFNQANTSASSNARKPQSMEELAKQTGHTMRPQQGTGGMRQ